KPARKYRGQADQRMEQAVEPVMDNLRSRDGNVLLDPREIVRRDLVVNVTAVRNQRGYTVGIQHVHADDPAAFATALEDIGVPRLQLGQNPSFIKLQPGLVVVRLRDNPEG